MNEIDVESLRHSEFEAFCDINGVLGLLRTALADPSIKHIHLQGPRYSGKTYLLEASLTFADRVSQPVMVLEPSFFAQPDWVEVLGGGWFFLDDVERLSLDEQSVFIAWLDAMINAGVKVLTSSPPLYQIEGMSSDLRSRLQSACPVILSHPEDELAWYALIHAFFKRRYIDVPAHITRALLRFSAGRPEYLFPLMQILAHQSERLTVSRVRAAYDCVLSGDGAS